MKESTKISILALVGVLLYLGAFAYLIFAIFVNMSFGRFGMGFLDWIIVIALAAGGKAISKTVSKETESAKAEPVTVEAEVEVEAETENVPEAPISAPVPAPAPESVVITCEKCGQTMLIPSGSGAVKITCPKCGDTIVHTY